MKRPAPPSNVVDEPTSKAQKGSGSISAAVADAPPPPFPTLPTLTPDVKAVEDFFAALDNVIRNAPSSALQLSLTKAAENYREILIVSHDNADVAIVDRLLAQKNMTFKQFVDMYEPAFQRHRKSMTLWPKPGSERSVIHPFLNELFSMAESIVKDVDANALANMCRVHEGRYDDNEPVDPKQRKIPDFSLRMEFASDSFLNAVVAIEAKEFGSSQSGTFQSIGYLLERLKCQFELCRDIKAKRSGVCAATDGRLLALSSVCCNDGIVAIEHALHTFGDHYLWPTRSEADAPGFKWKLKRLPGLVRLLLVFSSSAEDLGYVKINTMVAAQEQWILKEVLGMGAFCTVIRASKPSQPDASDVAMKVPRYYSPTAAAYDHSLKMSNEVNILAALKGIPHIPTICAVYQGIPAIVFEEVGCSMRAFISNEDEYTLIKYRRVFAQDLKRTLSAVLVQVADKGYTHRDIRPQNIVMMRKGRDFIPVLIDWALGGRSDALYEKYSAEFQGNGVITHFAQTAEPLKNYEPSFDVESLEYTIAAIVYNWRNLDAPWHDADKRYLLAVRQRMSADCMIKTYKVKE